MAQRRGRQPKRSRKRWGWGGWRPGAGRPRGPDPRVHHIRRPTVPRHLPSKVTVRVLEDVPSLRAPKFRRELRESLAQARERSDFRVVRYGCARDRVLLVVEASGKQALGRGMKAVSARIAFAANRAFERSGPVLRGRYDLVVIETPAEARRVIAEIRTLGGEAGAPGTSPPRTPLLARTRR